MKTKESVPLVAEVDVVVVGGASGGVAAAAAAARAGSRVFLAAAETYAGEDLCATGQLWLADSEPLDTPLARRLYESAPGVRCVPPRPLEIKRELEAELMEAGVRFLFGCVPADLLVDARGRVAGVVLASRTGLLAVTAKVVIDATPQALLAQLAGIPFTSWAGGSVSFTRVVIGARAAGDDGSRGRRLPGLVRGQFEGQPVELEAYEYTVAVALNSWSVTELAEAEQRVRDLTWHKDQTWGSDRLGCVPPVAVAREGGGVAPMDGVFPPEAFATSSERFFVLGPCAGVSREAAAALLLAPRAILAGDQLGKQAAALASASRISGKPRSLQGAGCDTAVQEPCTCTRFVRQRGKTIRGGAGGALPVLGEFDVVVVGGGTGGAPAAIAASRTGARVLLLESLHGLGGVGTLGCISIYYYGYREGFTEEVTQGLRQMAGQEGFRAERWNSLHKSEWFRCELRKAGGRLWYGALVSGAVVHKGQVTGVIVNTATTRGIIRAGVVIDATGNSDVAAAAGAACRVVSESDLAIQGSGLPSLPFRPTYHNTDYTFIDDGDPVDITRAFVVARRKFVGAFDLAQIADTRERRQIVGDVTVTPLDVYTGRTWEDTICLSRSNFDSHGFTVHPIYLVEPPDRVSLDAWLPLRALLPKGLEGVLVTGLGLSGQRDVMPVLRMQPDIQNHAYAAGLAAAMAVRSSGNRLRGVDIRALQRTLVDLRILPQTVLLHEESKKPAFSILVQAASGGLTVHAEIAALMSRPKDAIALLRVRLAKESDGVAKIQCAKLLAVLGDDAGEAVLLRAIAGTEWDKGWNYTGMGQYGRSLSLIDDCIVCLGLLQSRAARDAVIARIGTLDASQDFSHFRAVAIYAEQAGHEACAPALAGVLARPGIAGHAWTTLAEELADIPASSTDTRTRNESLRELYIARALYRCGDSDGVATRILETYSRDLRGHYARHAAGVMG